MKIWTIIVSLSLVLFSATLAYAQVEEKYDTSFYSQDTLHKQFNLILPEKDTLLIVATTTNIELSGEDTTTYSHKVDTFTLYNVNTVGSFTSFEVDSYSKKVIDRFLGEDSTTEGFHFPRIKAKYNFKNNFFRFDNKDEIASLIKSLYATKLKRDSINNDTKYHKHYHRDLQMADSSLLQKNIFLWDYLILFEVNGQLIPLNNLIKYSVKNTEEELQLEQYLIVNKTQKDQYTHYSVSEDLSKDKALTLRSTRAMAEAFKDAYPPEKWKEKLKWLNGLQHEGHDIIKVYRNDDTFHEYVHFIKYVDKVKNTTETSNQRIKVID